MKHAVVIGGYGEAVSQLEPVAEAACEAFNVADAVVMTYVQADRDPGAVARAVRGAAVTTHSLGAKTIPPDGRPEIMIAYNGPEPHHVGSLFFSAGKIALKHVGYIVGGGNPDENIRTAHAALNQIARHPMEHLACIPSATNFSSTRRVARMADAGINVKLVATEDDEFFSPDCYRWAAHRLLPRMVSLQITPGNHTTLLRKPAEMFARTIA